MSEYRLTPAAEADLEAICIYTVRRWGVDQGNSYIDVLISSFAQLAERPKTTPACDDAR
ncbi:type II toxin-antitoxin system RelE/ParE family toxin [Pseudomonas sp. DTU12.3]|uniref:type II toxin-antitoxin system RelE/ParE family toxin n=1 Tax=Pseudomonas sp. DTU12.3 TaxID=2073078 RepID=UPI00273EFD62|nr:type II toxin-antitoxin system RelE/ParE family toxin [Pseudomonas sp. DTU12.3]